ncbi:hypothetical protein [Aurantiacibacter sediminis]|uniref:Uncharacterized protein n=1 Tax=Aurantiacibacter sediminis TaxID=2793064 RepID=A0ABS0N007_9SPHN|nr:hypothetical protein [Aurantiacibacter sediminis]MBH5321302.1 hypothetical protein [Aurantiacibacter sediminis]
MGTLFVLAGFGIICAFAWRKSRKQIDKLLQRRPNPSREEFIALMAPDVGPEASEFLWGKAFFIVRPRLTPHPDDDLAKDLPILAEEWSTDWPRDWAEQQGFHESDLPDWPKDWPPTVRNFGKWLSLGPVG